MSDVPIKTADTPIAPQTFPAPTKADQVKGFIGDLARPFQTFSTSSAASWAIVEVAHKVVSADAALFIGAVLAGVGAIFVGKSWENVQKGKADAAIAASQATTA